MIFPTFFNLSLNFAIKSSWSEPQSTLGLVFADYIEFLHLRLQRIYHLYFDIDHLVMSGIYSSWLCCWKMVFAMTSVFSWENSVSLCPASFCTPRLNFPVTPGISWLPTLHSSPNDEKDIPCGHQPKSIEFPAGSRHGWGQPRPTDWQSNKCFLC